MSTPTSTAVISYQTPPAPLPTATEWETMTRMAQTLAKSGLVPSHLRTPEAAVAVILQGRELGIGAMQALRTIHLIEGRLTLSADLMAALIYHRCGGTALRIVERSAKQCIIDYQRPGWEAPARMTWTLAMAQQAGLTGKSNWQKHPDAMLFARCLSAIAHTAFQDVIMGLYTEDEAEEIAANEPAERQANVVNGTSGSASAADLPPITIVSAASADVAAVATEAEHRPAPPAPPADDRPLTMTQAKRLEESLAQAGWQVADVRRAAQDIYGRPLVQLTAAEARAFHAAASDGTIAYNDLTGRYAYAAQIAADIAARTEAIMGAPAAKAEAALPL